MKKMLFTGSSGFLGKNILSTLKEYYIVKTIDIQDNSDYQYDISSDVPIFKEDFDIVLHAAGKAHSVPKNENENRLFYRINYEGTKNLCMGFNKLKMPKFFIFISTVAVYGCEKGENISEEHPLNGYSPYARSKILAEQYLEEWCSKNNIILTILRPSLIAGVNPPGNLKAMIDGIKKGRYFDIAGGKNRKSLVMASDIVDIILLAEKKGGIYNICDNYNPSLYELEGLICKQLNRSRPYMIPYWAAYVMAKMGDIIGTKSPINSERLEKMVSTLTFSNEKIREELKFKPKEVLKYFKIE